MLWVFVLGSSLGGVAGILAALEVGMSPAMGMSALMGGVVVTVLGGRNSLVGLWIGALIVGATQNLAGWWIGSQWKDGITFALLILLLVFRPQGLFGHKPHSVSVRQ